jgi:hypothetical protein
LNTIFGLQCNGPTNTELRFDNISFDDVLLSLFRILDRNSFPLFLFEMNLIQSAIDLIDLPSFSEEIPSLTTFEENVQFLNNFIFLNFAKQFEDSYLLIPVNFLLFNQLNFSNLTNKSLENILSSENLHLFSETFLLQQIMDCPQKIHLMKFGLFPTIDYEVLVQFI